MYLSDTAKQHIKAIIKRWDELGHEPCHSEFNSDPKVTNAMASCFGSYSEAVKEARYYYNHPEQRYKLDPPPPAPPATGAKGKKRRTTTRKVQTIQAPSKPLEQSIPLRVGETRIEPKVTLKTPLRAPEEPKPNLEEHMLPAAQATLPEKAPEELIAIPEEPIPEEKPAPPLKETPEPEPEVTEEPTIIVEEPAIVKEVATMSQKIINLTGKTVKLVSKEQLRKALNGVMPDVSPLEDGGIATVMKANVDVDSYVFEAEDDLIEIPIVSVYGQPSLIKNKALHSFPDPKEGVLFLVSYEVIEAARDFGRDTDDLLYLLEYEKHDNCIYGRKLGRI